MLGWKAKSWRIYWRRRIITVHMPKTEETIGMIGKEIGLMKDGKAGKLCKTEYR